MAFAVLAVTTGIPTIYALYRYFYLVEKVEKIHEEELKQTQEEMCEKKRQELRVEFKEELMLEQEKMRLKIDTSKPPLPRLVSRPRQDTPHFHQELCNKLAIRRKSIRDEV